MTATQHLILHVQNTLFAFHGLYTATGVWLRVMRRHHYEPSWVHRTIFHLARWPALFAVLIDPFAQHFVVGGWDWQEVGFDVLGLIIWICLRNADDDDDWEKRVEAVLGRIKQVGQKLVIIPEPA